MLPVLFGGLVGGIVLIEHGWKNHLRPAVARHRARAEQQPPRPNAIFTAGIR
jgi:hypothetical protein